MHTYQRKSQTSLGKIYFWTATVHNWNRILDNASSKDIIIAYLKKLSNEGLLTIYAFVIMPNHIHIIFRQNKLNGKETPKGSLLKYTGHTLLKRLKAEGKEGLYKVNMANKSHQIWQRDSLGIEIYSKHVAKQKLDYIHFNPVRGLWQLAKDDISYYFSSARFYESRVDDFGFLNDLYAVFEGE